MNAIDFHNDIATQFDHRYESSRAFGERFRVWTDLFGRYVNATDHVMDLGCGSGIFSTYLANWGCSVIGIDGAVAMIELCNWKKTSANACYIVQSLPLDDTRAFSPQDVIIASSLLEYIDDLERVLYQINALLTPGGLLMVSMPNRLSVYRRVERGLFTLTGYPRYFAHIRHVTTETGFNRQLTGLGFDVLETKYFAGGDPLSRLLRWVLPARYVSNLFVGIYRKTKSANYPTA